MSREITETVKNILIMVLLLLFPTTLRAKTTPGKRPDLAPSKLMKIAGSSIEDRIVEQAIKVGEYRREWYKYSYTEKRGIWPFRYSPKERALKKLRKEEEILKNLLASTPSSVNAKKSEVFKDIDGVTNANAEILEFKLSLENLRNTVLQGRKELMAEPSNLEVASTYYEAHVTCLATIIQMAEEFIQNIDTKYAPAINELRIKCEVLRDKSDEKLRKAGDPNQAQQITKIKENQIAVINALREAYATLPKQKEWAKNRLINLKKRLEVAILASETLEATQEAKSLVQNFGIDYEKLEVLTPPLIIFEIDLSEFKLPDVKK